MDSYQRMDAVIAYIEDHLTDEIDYAEAARLAYCPTHQFPRIFAFLADMPLSEYIRRRKLSLAAEELCATRTPVIDIALKYGYDSHAAFARAFKEQHHQTPSAMRTGGAKPVLFPRITFYSPVQLDPSQSYRIEKGKVKMATLEHIEFIPFGPYKVVGKEIRTKPMTQDIPTLWGRCFSDGTYEKLMELKDYFPLETDDAYIGYIHGVDPSDGSFGYVVGLLLKPDAPVPDGFVGYDIPTCTLAKAWVKGEEYELYSKGEALTVAAIEQNGYKVDHENWFRCEVYTDERFGIPKNNGESRLTLDIYLPCKKM